MLLPIAYYGLKSAILGYEKLKAKKNSKLTSKVI
jgi:hypothetical protein